METLKAIWTRRNLQSLLAGALGGGLILLLFAWTMGSPTPRTISEKQEAVPARTVNMAAGLPVDFREASAIAMPAVVHIKSEMKADQLQRRMPNDELHRFFGMPFDQEMPQQPSVGSGSGVILTDDGYIVTNNHVIDNASAVSVSLYDNRSFTARVIGTDPSTDLALLKIEATELPFLKFGNSDALMVGEWVLAVGNPFNLTSTVTAGIVSAKGRNLGIVADKYRIESFIQTDAAVNPGNSGGALVNIQGELVGINTAIATRTGSYSGYSFAVPVSIVRKVVDDLMAYGAVQRGFLGVSIRDVDGKLAGEEDLKVTQGAFVAEVNGNSAAADAGIKKGDVITHVQGDKVKSASQLQELVGQRRPGDKLELKVMRGTTEKTFTVTLKNQSGTTEIVKAETNASLQWMGAQFEPLSKEDQQRLGISQGVKVTRLTAGKLRLKGVREGFVITQVNRQPVASATDIQSVLRHLKDGDIVTLEGYYAKGEREVVSFYY
ncbi:MAG: Do family serine endopeptidase [Bacteroidetes bacterium]|nr:Do family serine endopeptidase [Bacteroidota bacterium]